MQINVNDNNSEDSGGVRLEFRLKIKDLEVLKQEFDVSIYFLFFLFVKFKHFQKDLLF